MKRKITEIAVFEFFLCMFVILIHLLSEGVDTFPKWSLLSILFFSLTRLTTFAVPGFIFTSAIKMFYKYGDVKKFNYPRFLWDRFKKIYVPYLIAVVLYYLVFVFVLHTYNFDWHQLLQFIQTGDISAQFYFIILIIQFYLLMPVWLLLSRIHSTSFCVILVAVSFILTVAARMYFPNTPYGTITHKLLPCYLIFWVLGMYIGMHYESFARLVSYSKPVIYVGWLILSVVHCILSYMKFGGLITYHLEPVIVVFFCFFSIFGFYSYARELTISLESKGKGMLTSISQASYDIYLIHCLILMMCYQILTYMEIDNSLQRFFITAGITYVVSIVWCVMQATIYANIRAKYLRASATKARKMARRKRYL